VAANSAVTAPITATVRQATGDIENRNELRATRYTPAVTIVAAWMRADTGVGPAMASGSHTYSGICADLPQHPSSKNRVIAVAAAVVSAPGARSNTVTKSNAPTVCQRMNIAIRKPKSP